MKTVRLDLSYLGAGFEGWQSQPGGGGVQDHLTRALAILAREPVKVVGASRTDAGVHAEHQVARCHLPATVDLQRLPLALTSIMHRKVVVYRAALVAADFHPIRDCLGKIYRYRLWQDRIVSPFAAPWVWAVPGGLDQDEMRAAAASLLGRHDFSSFCASDSGAVTRVREIREIVIHGQGPLLEIWVAGDGFLKQMVRSIVGTLVAIGLGRQRLSMAAVLAAKDRRLAGVTAPAGGLSLVQLCYGHLISCDQARQAAQQGLGFGLPQ